MTVWCVSKTHADDRLSTCDTDVVRRLSTSVSVPPTADGARCKQNPVSGKYTNKQWQPHADSPINQSTRKHLAAVGRHARGQSHSAAGGKQPMAAAAVRCGKSANPVGVQCTVVDGRSSRKQNELFDDMPGLGWLVGWLVAPALWSAVGGRREATGRPTVVLCDGNDDDDDPADMRVVFSLRCCWCINASACGANECASPRDVWSHHAAGVNASFHRAPSLSAVRPDLGQRLSYHQHIWRRLQWGS